MPGIRDSSITRVAPVFGEIETRGRLPGSLTQLLSLPTREGQQSREWGDPGELEETAWWPKEKRLDPPRELLEYLVHELAKGSTRSSTVPNRKELLAGDREALAAALKALGGETVPPRAWYVFEGPTSVDAYVRTTRYVVLVEGKRTEPGPTTHTSWMDVRHQVLRNLDAAWDGRGEREVAAFFAVEADNPDDPDDTSVPEHWKHAVAATVSEEALAGSLPHRSEDVRQEMARAFLGAVTWQAICDEFSLPRDILIDKVPPDLRLKSLRVRGILSQLARDGQIIDVRCEMPRCYCSRGREYFEPRSGYSDWELTADHYPLLKMHGGQLRANNVRLAHRLCNRRDYTWRKKINALLAEGMSLEEIAEKLNAEKVPTIHGTNRWEAASVRKAFVS